MLSDQSQSNTCLNSQAITHRKSLSLNTTVVGKVLAGFCSPLLCNCTPMRPVNRVSFFLTASRQPAATEVVILRLQLNLVFHRRANRYSSRKKTAKCFILFSNYSYNIDLSLSVLKHERTERKRRNRENDKVRAQEIVETVQIECLSVTQMSLASPSISGGSSHTPVKFISFPSLPP